MKKTLKDEILSITIRDYSSCNMIAQYISDYCKERHINTSTRFAILFYYLFVAKMKENIIPDDYFDVAINILHTYIERYINNKIYTNTFIYIANIYETAPQKNDPYIIDNLSSHYVKIAVAFSNVFLGYDRYVDKDGDILFISNNFKSAIYYNKNKSHCTSLADKNKIFPLLCV